jgi:hypothetical protein
MVHFKPIDYKEILYPVHTLKKGMGIFESFPKLFDHDEFGVTLPPTLPFDKVFRYIVYAYDQKSPFVTQIDDLITRKKEAVQEAGFIAKNNSFSAVVKDMLNCENEKVNKMIIRYCRLQGKDFTNLMASQEAFYQINVQLLSNIQTDNNDDAVAVAKKKAELDKAADDFNERLNEKARRFLTQEIAQGLHDDLWSLAEDEALNINISPEDYAN